MSSRRSVWRLIAVGTSVLMLASACSSAATTAPTAAPTAAPTTAKKLTIGYVEFDPSSVYANQAANEDEKAFKAEGWDVIRMNSGGKQEVASDLMKTLVSRKVDAIVVSVYAGTQIQTGLAAANDAGIPVFKNGGGYAGEGEAGAISVIIAPLINDIYFEYLNSQPKVELLQLTFTPGEPARLRAEAFNKIADGLPNVNITKNEFQVPGQVEQSQQFTSAWLSAHPEQADTSYVIWGAWADPVVGAIAALKQAGRKAWMYTWDLTNPTAAAVREGTLMGSAIWSPPEGAKQMTQMIKDYMAAKDAGGTWTPVNLEAGGIVVTKDNIDQILAENTWVMTGG